ncbi:tRNA nucleotidyltransferase (CCA-adding enzyme) [Paenibacillus aceris]|uniref:tRNA nucleotidyltransferase (CCA-adding enzyme) n=1 Tax=Paenibacillus aceris TaxID=869555 RepID=A0ABS4HVB0_9BACL|nr:CCA tRNA nucleotidyltransferase [Paenibacillus aceris]MBP1961929.1 tRNA nucleotidyltransferase (CCA-adding enzyme) [Paenibacillus aceris]
MDAGKILEKDRGASYVLEKLTEAGYEAYLVGGCVRDAVLDRPIKDIDIATSALPEQVIACFPRTAPTGLQHGTVTVILQQGTYEVTTFRKEAEYEGFRRPSSVAYISDLTEDLKRRDFTMNAMAMDGAGNVVDPFEGQKDLALGVLRCVGKAEERFGEDALRMLRCIRFASTYELQVEESTWQALLAQAPLLRHIAMERVRSELQRMIDGPAPARAVRLLLASRLTAYLKKQLPLPFERWLAWDNALDAVSALEEQHDRWSMLLMLLEVPADIVRTALQELTFSRADGDAVWAVLALREEVAAQLSGGGDPQDAALQTDPAPLERVWKVRAVRSGEAAARALLRLLRVLQPIAGQRGELALFLDTAAPELVRRGEDWLREVPCFSLKELAISGKDLASELGMQPGPWMGKLLQFLLERTALGEMPNERESLLQAARAAK